MGKRESSRATLERTYFQDQRKQRRIFQWQGHIFDERAEWECWGEVKLNECEETEWEGERGLHLQAKGLWIVIGVGAV
jgi:hypothetical protein